MEIGAVASTWKTDNWTDYDLTREIDRKYSKIGKKWKICQLFYYDISVVVQARRALISSWLSVYHICAVFGSVMF